MHGESDDIPQNDLSLDFWLKIRDDEIVASSAAQSTIGKIIMRVSLMALGVAAMAFFTVPLAMAEKTPEKAQDHGVHWQYNGHGAAKNWGHLKKEYQACATGAQQSPIHIDRYEKTDLTAIEVNYKPMPLHVTNTGYTIEIPAGNKQMISIGKQDYQFMSAQFRTPSEHYINGRPYPMEMHLLHKGKNGALAVIAVMIELGSYNDHIEKIWQGIPAMPGTNRSSTLMILSELLPTNMEYYRYDGSLTTPPCTEAVRWHVLKDSIQISDKQLRSFQDVFPMNARSVQPLNYRKVSGN